MKSEWMIKGKLWCKMVKKAKEWTGNDRECKNVKENDNEWRRREEWRAGKGKQQWYWGMKEITKNNNHEKRIKTKN